MSPLLIVLLLAVLQGLAEYFPVSSSGHLVLLRSLVPGGGRLPGDATVEVVLHLGTLLAVIVFYRKELGRMAAGVFGAGADPAHQRRLFALVMLGTVPVAAAGLLAEGFIESLFHEPVLAAVALLANGCLLAASARLPGGERGLAEVGWRGALLIGLAQALALIPGFSRSGFTIIAGLALGLRVERAAAFSFFLSIPALLGAALIKLPAASGGGGGHRTVALGAGVLVSFLVGYLALGMLIWIVRARRLRWFAPYCLVAGATGLALTLFR